MSARVRAKIRAGLGDPAIKPARSWDSRTNATGTLFLPPGRRQEHQLAAFEPTKSSDSYDFRAPKLPEKAPRHFSRPTGLQFSALQTLSPAQQAKALDKDEAERRRQHLHQRRKSYGGESDGRRAWNNRTTANFDADKLRAEQTRRALAHSRQTNRGLDNYMTLRQRYRRSAEAAKASAHRQQEQEQEQREVGEEEDQ